VELDRIYCADSRAMEQVDDESVQLIVTSPPYNVGKNYTNHHDALDLDAYLAFLESVWRECQRVLVRGGRIAINVANTWRQPYIPLNAYIARQMVELGFLMRGEVIWEKGASAGISTAWGSFARASNPVLRDVHEYILVFSKDTLRLEETRGEHSGIENLEFVEWTKSVWRTEDAARRAMSDSSKTIWRFDTLSKRRSNGQSVNHPAPFPIDLPLRLILLYTNVGDVVLDPFVGSGTTALAAKLTQRHYLGYDISPEYCEMARERLNIFTGEQLALIDVPPGEPSALRTRRYNRKHKKTD
jgi:site-specific DNA-methyltransferase (adenine-specific)